MICLTVKAQQKEIESLKKELLSKQILDSGKVKVYYRLGAKYMQAQDSANAVTNFLKGLDIAKRIKQHFWVVYGYNELGYLYELTATPHTALKLYQTGISYGEKHQIAKETARAYTNISFVYTTLNDNYQSRLAIEKALTIYRKEGSKLNIAGCLNNLGIKYFNNSDYEKALEYYNEALILYQQLNEQKNISSTYLNIGQVNYELKNYAIANQYYQKSLVIAIKANDKSKILLAQNNIATLKFDQKDFVTAIPLFEELLKTSKEYNLNIYLNSLNSLAECYRKTGSIEKSKPLYKQALNEALKAEKVEAIGINYINYAGLLVEEKQYDEALAQCLSGLAIFKKYPELNKFKPSAYESIAEIYRLKKEYDNAFKYQDSQIVTKEFLINDQANSKLLALQNKYDVQQKEARINLLSKTDSIKSLTINKNVFRLAEQNLALTNASLKIAQDSLVLFSQEQALYKNKIDANEKTEKIDKLTKETLLKELKLQQKQIEVNKKNLTILLISAISLLAFIVAYALIRRKQLKQEAALAFEKAKQREITTKAIIEAEEAERKRIASDLHDGVGQMFSAVKMNLAGLMDRVEMPRKEDQFLAEKTLALVDESCKEVRIISHKMMPNFLLKSGIAADIRSFIEKIDEESLKISFETEGFSNQLEYSEEVILYRVIQELVNNVIKHADANTLNISLTKNKTSIHLVLSDNGKGFDYSKIDELEGLGVKNIKIRVDYLKGKLSYLANHPKGTTVKIEIPLA